MKKFRSLLATLALFACAAVQSHAGTPVPVVFQILGTYYNPSDQDLANVICAVNNRFANTNGPGFNLYILRVLRVPNDSLPSGINSNNFEYTYGKVPQAINIYLGGMINSTGNDQYQGSYLNPGSNYVYGDLIKNSFSDPALAHEIGHMFSLPHTVGCGATGTSGPCSFQFQCNNMPAASQQNNLMNGGGCSSNYSILTPCQGQAMASCLVQRGWGANPNAGTGAVGANAAYQPPVLSYNAGTFSFTSSACAVAPSQIDIRYWSTLCQDQKAYYGVVSGGTYLPECVRFNRVTITYHYPNTADVNTVTYTNAELPFQASPYWERCTCGTETPNPPKTRRMIQQDEQFSVQRVDNGRIGYTGAAAGNYVIVNALGQIVTRGRIDEPAGTIDVSMYHGMNVLRLEASGFSYKFVVE